MRKDFHRNRNLEACLPAVTEALGTKEGLSPFLPLVQLVADVLDTAAQGEDCFLTIGVTRNRDAYIGTVHLAGQKIYVSGTSLRELVESCKSVL